MVKKTSKKQREKFWAELKEHQKDPEFIRAAYEFVRYHTGHRPHLKTIPRKSS